MAISPSEKPRTCHDLVGPLLWRGADLQVHVAKLGSDDLLLADEGGRECERTLEPRFHAARDPDRARVVLVGIETCVHEGFRIGDTPPAHLGRLARADAHVVDHEGQGGSLRRGAVRLPAHLDRADAHARFRNDGALTRRESERPARKEEGGAGLVGLDGDELV